MAFNFLVLFIVAILAGFAAFLIPEIKEKNYKLGLVFAGGYLFAVTLIHILPETFAQSVDPTNVGLFVLVGFFLQQILEYFTAGAEHGHVHRHEISHHHKAGSAIMVLAGLSVHAFLEGTLLAHPGSLHRDHESNALLFGILLHKAPAAFALMSILLCQLKRRYWAVIFLLVFSLASPLGLFFADFFAVNNKLSGETFSILFAIVSGNFLHISTTIVFESSANHHFNIKKLGAGLLGAFVAVSAEYFF